MRKHSIIALLLCAQLLTGQMARADHQPGHPKIEWGPALALIHTPDYLGSSHSQTLLVPFPYLKYRGDILRIDDGIEARLFKKPGLVLSVSGNGSLPSTSQDNERSGMADLDALVEFGPSLEYRLLDEAEHSLWLELPLRQAISLGQSISTVGRVLTPRLAWRKADPGKFDWKLRLALGPIYADRNYLNHFYAVGAEDVTATRAEYQADSGGYHGFRIDFTYSRRIGTFWLGGFIRQDSLSGSVIENSPLVSQHENLTAGISLAWVISEH